MSDFPPGTQFKPGDRVTTSGGPGIFLNYRSERVAYILLDEPSEWSGDREIVTGLAYISPIGDER
jgi:hypothetical protein